MPQALADLSQDSANMASGPVEGPAAGPAPAAVAASYELLKQIHSLDWETGMPMNRIPIDVLFLLYR